MSQKPKRSASLQENRVTFKKNKKYIFTCVDIVLITILELSLSLTKHTPSVGRAFLELSKGSNSLRNAYVIGAGSCLERGRGLKDSTVIGYFQGPRLQLRSRTHATYPHSTPHSPPHSPPYFYPHPGSTVYVTSPSRGGQGSPNYKPSSSQLSSSWRCTKVFGFRLFVPFLGRMTLGWRYSGDFLCFLTNKLEDNFFSLRFGADKTAGSSGECQTLLVGG